ncbi:MAG: hypothetical protein ACLFRX_06650, partial [Gemmatimonadota bacterium]
MESNATLARGGVLAGLIALCALPSSAAAQYEAVPRPAAYALEDVTVVQADGRREEGVTVVVRGGLIEALGRGVVVPADAERLEGDSLVVYPGVIDAQGEAGYEYPQPEIDRRRVEAWNAPRELQGFTPSRRVVAHLTVDGGDVAAQRRAGIVAGAVHPRGAMMPGRGTLVLYRADAATADRLVVEPELGPTITFRGGQGVYPATLFGTTAFIRQAFEDARHRARAAEAHARDPRRMTTPVYDPDYAVLADVLDGGAPVFFEADEAADILRALRFGDELGFRPIVVGGAEAWKVTDELKRRDVPVLVSADFGTPRQWDP